jgi:RNA polymerase sigma factor (sigma-70 family)
VDGRPESGEALVERLLPSQNPDPIARAHAWCEWYQNVGETAVLAFIRTMNDTPEPDMDILQDAMMAAYQNVERGAYEPCDGVPFTAYVKGIARNKLREARRRVQPVVPWEESVHDLFETFEQRPDMVIERQEQRSALRMGLSRLSRHRRTVLEGFLVGQSTSEIADALGISEELVRQHKSRGLRTLRQMDLFAVPA